MEDAQGGGKLATAGFLCLFSVTVGSIAANAIAAPPQLLGKSLILSWQSNRVERNTTSGETRQYGTSTRLQVYVSSKGRFFTEKTGIAQFRRGPEVTTFQEVSDSPESKEIREWRLEGPSLVAYHAFKSGIRRMAIDFDGDYRTCSLKVSFAKLGGTENIIRGHGKWEILSIEVSSSSCRIQEGNVFEQSR